MWCASANMFHRRRCEYCGIPTPLRGKRYRCLLWYGFRCCRFLLVSCCQPWWFYVDPWTQVVEGEALLLLVVLWPPLAHCVKCLHMHTPWMQVKRKVSSASKMACMFIFNSDVIRFLLFFFKLYFEEVTILLEKGEENKRKNLSSTIKPMLALEIRWDRNWIGDKLGWGV